MRNSAVREGYGPNLLRGLESSFGTSLRYSASKGPQRDLLLPQGIWTIGLGAVKYTGNGWTNLL